MLKRILDKAASLVILSMYLWCLYFLWVDPKKVVEVFARQSKSFGIKIVIEDEGKLKKHSRFVVLVSLAGIFVVVILALMFYSP